MHNYNISPYGFTIEASDVYMYPVHVIRCLCMYIQSIVYTVAALRYQHLAATHYIQGDYTKTNMLLVRADGIISEIKDNQLHMYSRFLSSCNCILNGNFKEAIQGTEMPQEQFTEGTYLCVAVYLSYACMYAAVHLI